MITKKLPLYRMKNNERVIVDYTLVDEDTYEKFKDYKLNISNNGYVRVQINRHSYYLHRLILGEYDGKHIDHINQDKKDNRRDNLRFVTIQENNYNCVKRKNTSTQYRGVGLRKDTNKYCVQIWKDKVRVFNCSRFYTLEMAVLIYNIKAKELYGDFAYINQLPLTVEEIITNELEKGGDIEWLRELKLLNT